MSRPDSTRSIKGRMPCSLEIANDSSSRDMAFWWSPDALRWSSVSALRVVKRVANWGGKLSYEATEIHS